MHSIDVGDYAELITASVFKKKGHIVSKPMTVNSTYDLIVDIDGDLKKVQVKSRITRDNKICVELYTSMRNYKRIYNHSDFDILVVYSSELDRLAIFNWDDIKDVKTLTLRTKPPANNQKAGIRMFDDYLFN